MPRTMLFNGNIMWTTMWATHIILNKKLKEAGEINFNNTFYLTQ